MRSHLLNPYRSLAQRALQGPHVCRHHELCPSVLKMCLTFLVAQVNL